MTRDLFPYTVKIANSDSLDILDIFVWCRKCIGTGGFRGSVITTFACNGIAWECEFLDDFASAEFRFSQKADAVAFQLRWAK